MRTKCPYCHCMHEVPREYSNKEVHCITCTKTFVPESSSLVKAAFSGGEEKEDNDEEIQRKDVETCEEGQNSKIFLLLSGVVIISAIIVYVLVKFVDGHN